MIRTVTYLILMLILGGCAKETVKVAVFVNTKFISNNTVIIDDTLTLKVGKCKKEYCKFDLMSGEHILSINNKKEKFNVSENGGVLNVEHCDFVIFPIKYTSNDEITKASIETDFPIIVDSLIIYGKNIASNQINLVSLLRNPNSKEIFNYNLEKIDKSQLFINRNWDYDINDTISDTLSVKTTAEKGIIANKRKIVDAKLFVFYAKISNVYNVELIEEKELMELIENFKKE
jgi:hypothetical protein